MPHHKNNIPLDKASQAEHEKWIFKVKGLIDDFDFTGHCRESRLFDLGHVNTPQMLEQQRLNKVYTYFHVKKIHHSTDTMASSWTESDTQGSIDDKLPPVLGREIISRFLLNVMDLGATGPQTKKYPDFTRKKPDGSLIVCECLLSGWLSYVFEISLAPQSLKV